MSNPNVGQLVAATWTRMVTDAPEDNIFRDRWLFNEFTTKNGGIRKVTGGTPIGISIEYATNPTFRSYNDTEVIDVQKADVFDEAQYEWKEHSGSVTYSVKQEWLSSGDAAKFDLIGGLVENALNSHKDDISDSMYGDGTGNLSKDINGLQNLIPDNPATGTRGAINAATFSFWRSNQASGAQTTNDFDNLRARMRSMYNTCSDGVASKHPKVGVTTQTVFEGYESLLIPGERFSDKKEGDAGFPNEVLKFKGMRLSFDASCPSARMYFLNPEYIFLMVAKEIWMKLGKELEPVNQNIRVRKVHSLLQFVVKQPRRLGVLTSIS
jgi:hypothetical protein